MKLWKIALASVGYFWAGMMAAGLAVIFNGDCFGDKTCQNEASWIARVGIGLVVLGYPPFLWWLLRSGRKSLSQTPLPAVARPHKPSIMFVKAFETDAYTSPAELKKFGLDPSAVHRLAVIQHGPVPESDDTSFDEVLWRHLLGIMIALDLDAEVFVTETSKGDRLLDDFLVDWDKRTLGDKNPPDRITLRGKGGIIACMVTEYWYQAGGPWPYADSYTYSLLTRDDLSDDLPVIFREGQNAARWTISTSLIDVSGRTMKDIDAQWRRP